MTHEDYMRQAIEVAKESERQGGAAIGAILVKDDQVIAQGMSFVWPHKDPSAHAETSCIKAACKHFDSIDLNGCVLYSTLESCGMCVSCAAWANLSTIYFGTYREDVPENAYEIKDWNSENAGQNMTLWDGKPLSITGGILREECKKLLRGYKNWSKVLE